MSTGKFKIKALQVTYSSRIAHPPESLSEGTYSVLRRSCDGQRSLSDVLTGSWEVAITIASITWSNTNISCELLDVKAVVSLGIPERLSNVRIRINSREFVISLCFNENQWVHS
jgi:hypothetical protein